MIVEQLPILLEDYVESFFENLTDISNDWHSFYEEHPLFELACSDELLIMNEFEEVSK